MALCSCFKSSTQLAMGQQQRNLGHRSAAAERGSSVRTRVAQPSASSARPSSAIFEHSEALVKGNHLTRHQAESLLTVVPTMKAVASKDDFMGLERAMKDDIMGLERAMKDDIMGLERAMKTAFEEQKSRFHQMQLLMVLLTLVVVVILGLLVGPLVVFPLHPSSGLGMVISAFIKKM